MRIFLIFLFPVVCLSDWSADLDSFESSVNNRFSTWESSFNLSMSTFESSVNSHFSAWGANHRQVLNDFESSVNNRFSAFDNNTSNNLSGFESSVASNLGVTADFSAHVSDLSSSLVHNSDSLSSSLSSNFSNMESSLSSVLGDDYSLVSSYVETLRSELATLSDDISSFLADGSAEADLLSDVQDSAESESQSLINSPSGAEWMRVMDKTYSYNMIDSSLSIAGSWLDCYRLTKITHVEGSEDFEINGITVSPGGTGMGWLYLGGNGSTFITAYSGSRVKLHVYWTDSDGNGLTDDLDDTDGDGVPNGNDDADRGGIPSDSDRDGDGINDDLATPDIPNFNFETGIPNLDRILDKLSPDINFKPAGQSNYNLDFSINSGAAGTFNFSLGDYSLIDDVRVTIRIISKVAFSFFFLLSVIKALRQW